MSSYGLEDELSSRSREALRGYNVGGETRFRESFQEVYEYYQELGPQVTQERYTNKKGEQKTRKVTLSVNTQAAMALSGTTDKKSLEYKNMLRYVQRHTTTATQKSKSVDIEHTQKAAQVGETLPPLKGTVGKALVIKVIAGYTISETKHKPHTLTIEIPGDQLQEWVDNGDWDVAIDFYFGETGLVEEGSFKPAEIVDVYVS